MKKLPQSTWTFPLKFNQRGNVPIECLDSKKIKLTKKKLYPDLFVRQQARTILPLLSATCPPTGWWDCCSGWACADPQNKPMQVLWDTGGGVGQAPGVICSCEMCTSHESWDALQGKGGIWEQEEEIMLSRFGIVYLLINTREWFPSWVKYAEEHKQNNKLQIIDNSSENLEAIENFLLEHSCNLK